MIIPLEGRLEYPDFGHLVSKQFLPIFRPLVSGSWSSMPIFASFAVWIHDSALYIIQKMLLCHNLVQNFWPATCGVRMVIYHLGFQRSICPDGEQASGPSKPPWCPDDDLGSEPIIRGPRGVHGTRSCACLNCTIDQFCLNSQHRTDSPPNSFFLSPCHVSLTSFYPSQYVLEKTTREAVFIDQPSSNWQLTLDVETCSKYRFTDSGATVACKIMRDEPFG